MKDKEETLNMIIGSFFVIFMSLVVIGFGCGVYAVFSPFLHYDSTPSISVPQEIPSPQKEVTDPVAIPTLDATQWTNPDNVGYNLTYIVVAGGGGGSAGYYNSTIVGNGFYINSTTGGGGYGQSNYYQWG
jgi:hypothetical protein